jgi:hypothetical protein
MIENFDPPHDEPDGQRRERHPQQVVNAADQLQRQSHTADLSSERHQVDHEGGTQVKHGDSRPKTFSDQLECRTAAHRRHPPRHLCENADADHTHGHGPTERKSEARAHHRVGHQVPDIDEAANRRQDA